MTKLFTNRIFLWSSGILLTLLGIYAAVNYQFKNSYEILLLGLILCLFGFNAPRNIKGSTYLKIYVVFFILGLFGDLLVGLNLTKLWFYNYDQLWQYLLLYTWIYPIGGLTMILSFITALDFFKVSIIPKNKTQFDYNDEIILFIGGNLILILCAVLKIANIGIFVSVVINIP